MARGWESKAVEAQQDAALAVAVEPTSAEIRKADVDRRKILEGLELQRASVSGDLSRASATAHRAMLEQAIAHIDQQINELKP